MAKLLPIKFFEKRRRDELRTEGGGSNTVPKWQLNGSVLSEHAQELQDGVSELSTAYDDRKKEDHELPMVMVTTINEEAIAKSHRAEVVNLLNSDGNPNVIGLETELHVEPPLDSATAKKENDEPDLHETRMLLSIVTSDELLANINRKLQDTQGSAKLISSITGMKVFEGRAGIYNPNNKAYRVVLIDYQDTGRNLLAQRLFRNQCSANGITIDHETRYSPDMKLFRVTIDSLDEMEMVRKFEGVRYIEESKPILIDTDSLDDNSIPAIKMPKEGESYPTIGVLDSGIRKNAYLSPWLLDQSEEYYGEELQDKSHGSMVASVLEYSDELNGTDFASTDGVMMLEAIVLPDRS